LCGCCTCWPAAGFSSEVRAGVDPLKTSPARQRRARGRIEQTLLDGACRPHPHRPKTLARKPTIPQEVPNVSIYDKGPGLLAHRHVRNASRKSGRIGGRWGPRPKKAGARRAPALYRSMAGGPRDLLPPLHHLTRHLGHACLCIGGTYFWGRHH
jgi:hypothetical protein